MKIQNIGTIGVLIAVAFGGVRLANKVMSSRPASLRVHDLSGSDQEPNPFARPSARAGGRGASVAHETRNALIAGRATRDTVATSSAPVLSPAQRLKRDLAQLGELHSTPEARRIFSPRSHDIYELVHELKGDRASMGRMMQVAREFSVTATDCLGVNLCDQRPEKGYFDPYDTRLHTMLNQSLEFMKAARDSGEMHDGLPSRDELMRNLSVHNRETQILSMELLLDNASGPPPDELRSQLLAQAPQIRNDAKPLYFELMSAASTASPEAHAEYVQALQQSLQNDDINTVTETVKHLDQLKVSESEFPKVVGSLCYIKRDPAVAHNWGQIDAYSNDYYERNSFNTQTPDQICH
jgi:hypothetical protein